MEEVFVHYTFNPWKISIHSFVLLVAAGLKSPNNNGIRLLCAFWCVAVSVVTMFYSVTLVSFIMTPTTKSLVISIEDLGNRDDVGLLVFKDHATEIIILVIFKNVDSIKNIFLV